jgi:hypothetical protein
LGEFDEEHMSITPERIAAIRQAPHGPTVDELMAEIERFWAALQFIAGVRADGTGPVEHLREAGK